MIELIKAGPLTTVQDLGRTAWRDRGISHCGALDDLALCQANLLVGNDVGAAGLEFTLGPALLRLLADGWLALTGTDSPAALDGRPVRPGWRTRVRAGQMLKIAAPRERMRTVLAVSGGIDVPLALGSRSTDLKAGFGGLDGRALKDGDLLPWHPPPLPDQPTARSIGLRPPPWSAAVRVLPGPEHDQFAPEARASTEPAKRKPIVLLADAQTTGGYPKIGVVIRADLWKLAQLRLGGALRFLPCTREEAVAALRDREAELDALKVALCLST
jgi:5-oxoprolinase (ATP-hydrolysing) subunit C